MKVTWTEKRFSRVRLCATPETAAHQAPRSLGFSGKNTGVGQIHQSLGKPTITTEHAGGDLVNETTDFPLPPCFQLLFSEIHSARLGREAEQCWVSGRSGEWEGTRSQVVMPLAPCQGSSLDKNISNRNPWDCLRLCAHENKFRISYIKAKK